MSERGSKILRFLDFYAGIPLCLASSLWRLAERPGKKFAIPEAPKVGIICLGAIGDALLLSALADGVRKKKPNAWIELILSSSNSEAAQLVPGVDSSAFFPVARLDKLVRHVRGARYDLLFDSTQWARIGAVVSNFSRSGLAIGFKTKGQARDFGYDQKARHRPDVHETDNFLSLGKTVWNDFSGSPSLRIPDSAANEPGDSRTVYCHLFAPPGKGKALKEWPAENWAELIAQLIRLDFTVALTGAGRDAEPAREFIDSFFKGNPKVRNLAGKFALADMACLFSRAAAVVSINTGIMHLAALAGAPTVGLHGPANPERWGPVGPRAISLLPDSGEMAYLNLGFEFPANPVPCMKNLPVAKALSALESLGVLRNR